MRKEKNKAIYTNQDWLKEKYVFASKYTVASEDKQKNISKLYRNIDRQYTDTVHLSKTFLERFFK
tara:strand:+ start:824 stop:1018 length:195 start_codon:yes stop_codon:yes gene_type:complete